MSSIKKHQNEKKPSSKRRAIIKGSATAVPLVLTLRSGAAFAATSATACVVNTQTFLQNNPDQKPVTLLENGQSEAISYVRILTTGRVLVEVDANNNPVAGGQTLAVFLDPNSPYPDGSVARWYNVDENNMSMTYYTNESGSTGGIGGIMVNNANSKKYKITDEQTDCAVLCYVDSNGMPYNPPVYGSAPGDGSFPFATTSCMASITG